MFDFGDYCYVEVGDDLILGKIMDIEWGEEMWDDELEQVYDYPSTYEVNILTETRWFTEYEVHPINLKDQQHQEDIIVFRLEE